MSVQVCGLVCYIVCRGGVPWRQDMVSVGLWSVCGFMDGGPIWKVVWPRQDSEATRGGLRGVSLRQG